MNGWILSTLEKEYDNFKDLWDTIPSENQRVNLLIEKLCTIELRDQNTEKPTAFVARSASRKNNSESKANGSENQWKVLNIWNRNFHVINAKQHCFRAVFDWAKTNSYDIKQFRCNRGK